MADVGRIKLVGGPGDGEEHADPLSDLLEWKPTDDRDRVLARMAGRSVTIRDAIEYRRSRRTRTLFIYQP